MNDLPEGATLIEDGASDGLPPGATLVDDSAPDGSVEIPVTSARDQFVKSAGKMLAHAKIVAMHAASDLLDPVGRSLSDLSEKEGLKADLPIDAMGAASKAAGYKANAAEIALDPIRHSQDIVERLGKAAHESVKQFGLKVSDEEREHSPNLAALGPVPMKAMRAFQALIDTSLPEVAALGKWIAVKQAPLTDRLNEVINASKRKTAFDATSIAPVETTDREIPKFDLALRTAYEVPNQIVHGAAELAVAMLNPVTAVEAELMGKVGGLMAKGALTTVAKIAPEAGLRVLLSDVSKLGESAQARLTKKRLYRAEGPNGEAVLKSDWSNMDHVHERVATQTKAALEGVQDRMGATPQAIEAATKAADRAGYEQVFRHLTGLPDSGIPVNLGPRETPGVRYDGSDATAPRLLSMDGARGEGFTMDANQPQGPMRRVYDPARGAEDMVPAKTIPVEPVDIAAQTIGAGALGPAAKKVAETYPSLYAVSMGAEIPQEVRVEVAEVRAELLQRGVADGPLLDMLTEANETGKGSFVRLSRLNDTLFKAFLSEQGAHPGTIDLHLANAKTATERPGETLVAHAMEVGDQKAAVMARAKATDEVWEEAHRELAEAQAKSAPKPAEPAPEQAPVEAAAEPLPGRAEGMEQAVEAGVPLEQAAGAQYAAGGDIDFDPVALEAMNHVLNLAKPAAELTWEEFQARYPGMEKDTHQAIIDDYKHKAETEARGERADMMESAGISAQPAHDVLRGMPIGEKWIEKLGLGGEFANSKGKGITTKSGDGIKVDYAVGRLIEAGILPEGSSVNDMIDLLDHEARKGSKASAEASMVREGETEGQGESSSAPEGKGPARSSSSSPISVDQNIADVKARADDWLGKEAAGRGMALDDSFRLQFATYVHFRANEIMREMNAEMMALPEADRQKWMAESSSDVRYEEGELLHEKAKSLKEAHPEIAAKVPKGDRAAESKILEGFKPFKAEEGGDSTVKDEAKLNKPIYSNPVRALLNEYNDGETNLTVPDLVDQVEGLLDNEDLPGDTTALADSVASFRDEQVEDIKLKGRGDMAAEEDKFMAAVEAYVSASGGSIVEDAPGFDDGAQGFLFDEKGTVNPAIAPIEEKAVVLPETEPQKVYGVTGPIFVSFNGKTYPVESLAAASAKWNEVRAASQDEGLGSRDLSESPLIVDAEGKTLGYISYNGRTWKGEPRAQGRGIEWRDDLGWGAPEAKAIEAAAPAAPAEGLPLSEATGERKAIIENANDRPFKKGEKGLQDSGSELWYNRRNIIGRGLKWDDIKGMNATLKALEVTKTKVWPRPDYEDLVAGGMNPLTAHLVKQVYDSIATKPSVSGTATDAQMEAFVNEVARIKEATFTWAKNLGTQRELLDSLTASAKARMGGQSIISQMGRSTSSEDMLDALYPKNAEGARWGSKNQDQNDLVRLVGGDKLINSLRIDTESARIAVKAINKGWPAPQEAWEKRFEVREVPAGTKQWSREKGEHTTTVARFEIKVLASRGMMVRGEFATREAAIARAKELAAKKPDTRRMAEAALTEFERKGPPQRPGGLDVTPKSLQDKFRFRGINYGNYTDQGERQVFTNNAYDSLLDLADIVGLPAAAISLNGTLGLAYGAQGRGGKYAAHFVPGVNEINLTKDAGAGSLAHEWWHAIDHYFAVQAGESYAKGADPYLTHHVERGMWDIKNASPLRPQGGLAGLRPEIRQAFLDIVESMKKVQETPEQVAARIESYKAIAGKRLDQWLKYFRDRFEAAGTMEMGKPKTLSEKDKAINVNHLKQFDLIAGALRRGDLGSGWEQIGRGQMSAVRSNVGELRRLYKDVVGHVPSPDDVKALDSAASSVKIRNDAKTALEDQKPQSTESQYSKDARGLDGGKKTGKEYWSRETELGARAFQSYILDRLEQQDRRNDYLTRPQGSKMDYSESGGDPYPRGAERAKINAAFDVLVNSLKTKETEAGTMVYDAPENAPAVYDKPSDEEAKAYGPGVDMKHVAKQIEMDLGPVLGEMLKKDARINYKGITVITQQEIKDLVAAARKEELEHLHLTFHTPEGKRLGHMTVTSFLPNGVMMTSEQKSEARWMFDNFGGNKKGVKVTSVHNHPSENHSPSEGDRIFDKDMHALFEGGYTETVVTDDTEFSAITKAGTIIEKFEVAQPHYYDPMSPMVVDTPRKMIAMAAKDAMLGKSPVVLYMDARNRVMSMENYSLDENLPSAVKDGIVRRKASGAIVVSPQSLFRTEFVKEVQSIVKVDANGKFSDFSAPMRSLNTASAYGKIKSEYSSSMVSDAPEGLPGYMGANGMDADDFAKAIAEKKIVPGSTVTLRIKFEGTPAGTPAKVLALDQATQQLLVKFQGETVPREVRSEKFSETNRKPAARAAVEQAERDARKSGKPSQPIKRTVAEQTGMAKPKPTVTEPTALKGALEAEARGAKTADALARKEMRAKMRGQERAARAELGAAQKDMRHTMKEAMMNGRWQDADRKKLIAFSEAFLPPSIRGNFTNRITAAKTVNDHLEVVHAIDQAAQLYANKKTMESIRALVRRVQQSKSFPIGIKLQIDDLISDIRLENWNDATLDKVAAQQALIAAAQEAGAEVDVPQAVLDQIAKLTKRPLAEMDGIELADILADLRFLVERGKEIKSIAGELRELDREEALADLVAGTKKVIIKPSTKGEVKQGVKDNSPLLTWTQRAKNGWLRIADGVQSIGIFHTVAQSLLDELDGTHLGGGPNRREWERLQSAFIDKVTYARRKKKAFADDLRKIESTWGKINEKEVLRAWIIGVSEMRDVRPHLHKMGYTDEDIKDTNLTAKERAILEAMKSPFADQEAISQLTMVTALLTNSKFIQEPNYLPLRMKNIKKDSHESAQEILSSEVALRKKSPERGMLVARQAGAARAIRMDLSVIEDAIDAQANLMYMAMPLLRAHSIFTDPAYEAAAGDAAVEFWRDFIDAHARDGKFPKNRADRYFERIMGNVGVGALTFKPHVALLQFSSLGPGAVVVGGGFIKQAIRAGKEWDGFVDANMPLVEGRQGGDQAVRETTETSILPKATEVGFKQMVQGDHWTAAQVALGAYFQFMDRAGLPLDPNHPHPPALRYAQSVPGRTMASPWLIDAPLARSRSHGFWKGLLQFQGESLAVFSLIKDEFRHAGQDKTRATASAAYLGAALVYETGIRIGWQWFFMAVLFGIGAINRKQWEDFEKKDVAVWKRLMAASANKIPFIGAVSDAVMYDAGPIPVVNTAVDLLGGLGNGIAGAVNGKPIAAMKGISQGLTSFAILAGGPGAGMAGAIARQNLKGKKDKPENKKYGSKKKRGGYTP